MALQPHRQVAVTRHDSAPWLLRLLTRNRYQLLGATLVAVVLPALVRSGFDIGGLPYESSQNTLVGTFLAMLLGTYLLRRITVYPGVSTVSTMLPAFTAAYGLAVLLFFFARLDYSRFQFIASFLLALGWFGFIGVIEPRIQRPRLLLLPFGGAETLLATTQAEWIIARSSREIPADVGGVVADFRAGLDPEWERLLAGAALSGLPVYHWKQLAESLSGTVDIEHLSENNLGALLPSSIYLRFKHLVDVSVALLAVPVAVLISIPTMIAILAEDGRPVFFRQTRMGFRGHRFTMWKFRTMRRHAAGERPAFTLANDDRITRVGAFLRHYRIDELPQIINILKGEMSWIGPRPEAIELSEWYESKIPFYSYRHIVRPGITGWAQINQGNVAEIRAATGKLHYDFFYIKYVSPWLDLLIAARTIGTILTGFGSR
jgi:lipopolysaccharide/colanic/teichoic acid biosynthesis glycosyltransferase